MDKQALFANAQILTQNPILQEGTHTRSQYYAYLKWLLRLERWQGRNYVSEMETFYHSCLCDGVSWADLRWGLLLDPGFSYLMPFDLASMLEYDQGVLTQEKINAVIRQMIASSGFSNEKWRLFHLLFDAALGMDRAWDQLLHDPCLKIFRNYLCMVRENISFIRKTPAVFLVTATMSAGKSTLTNALVGKMICRAQNMACTSRIHHIIAKTFEDGIISQYDYGLKLDAKREDLLNTNADGKFSDAFIGTYFDGLLGGSRLVLLDTPGVNSSENTDHMKVTRNMLRSKDYRYLLYVLNSTQLGTNDEEQHLRCVADEARKVPILFIMNKIDCLMTGEDLLLDVIQHQRDFLASIGFKDPLICPVSAKAAFLMKKSRHECLNRIDRRELENLSDKFASSSLSPYYTEQLHCKEIPESQDEMQNLFRNCGFAYLEKIMLFISNGGIINGTDLCEI